MVRRFRAWRLEAGGGKGVGVGSLRQLKGWFGGPQSMKPRY